MKSTLSIFWDICLFRKGPQDVYKSIPLLIVSLVIYAVISILFIAAHTSWPHAIVNTLFSLLLWAVFSYVILMIRNKRNRFVQMYTAYLGCSIILEVLAAILLILQIVLSHFVPTMPDVLMIVVGVISLIPLIWAIVIQAHIIRHSIDVPLYIGIILVLALFVVGYLLARILGS